MLLLSLQYYEYYIIDTYRVRGRVPPIRHYNTRTIRVSSRSLIIRR